MEMEKLIIKELQTIASRLSVSEGKKKDPFYFWLERVLDDILYIKKLSEEGKKKIQELVIGAITYKELKGKKELILKSTQVLKKLEYENMEEIEKLLKEIATGEIEKIKRE